jgi:hypothetical protein
LVSYEPPEIQFFEGILVQGYIFMENSNPITVRVRILFIDHELVYAVFGMTRFT